MWAAGEPAGTARLRAAPASSRIASTKPDGSLRSEGEIVFSSLEGDIVTYKGRCCASAIQFCQLASDYATLRKVARDRQDLLSFAALIILC
jgi:hypothetical protein